MFIIFASINLALILFFISILKRFSVWASIVVFFVTILESIFVAFFTLIFFGGAYGPGVLMFLCSPILVLVVFIAWIIIGVRQFPQLDKLRKVIFVLGGAVFLVAQASPFIGIIGIGEFCDEKKMEYGNNIVAAVEQYHNDNGSYPSSIESLTPYYLPSKPVYDCVGNLGLFGDLAQVQSNYVILNCDGKPSLVIRSTDLSRTMWYEFDTQAWSAVSYMDVSCYPYLE